MILNSDQEWVKYEWNGPLQPQMVGFCDLVGVGIAPVPKKPAVMLNFWVHCFLLKTTDFMFNWDFFFIHKYFEGLWFSIFSSVKLDFWACFVRFFSLLNTFMDPAQDAYYFLKSFEHLYNFIFNQDFSMTFWIDNLQGQVDFWHKND